MKWFLIFITLISLNVPAEEKIENPFAGMQVSKDEISQSLDLLKKEGKISEADYLKSKKALSGMNQSQIDGINKKALNIVIDNPHASEEMQKDLAKPSK